MSSSTSTPIFLTSIEATPNPSSATVKRSTPPTTLSNPSPTTAIIFTLVPSTGQWDKATVNDTLPPAMEGFEFKFTKGKAGTNAHGNISSNIKSDAVTHAQSNFTTQLNLNSREPKIPMTLPDSTCSPTK
jgi:hypothetical protein